MRLARPSDSVRWHSVSASPATTFSGLAHRARSWHSSCALHHRSPLFTTPVRGKIQLPNLEEHTMIWETPAYVDIRLGFEVTMYVYNR